jgi:hypothetical protein
LLRQAQSKLSSFLSSASPRATWCKDRLFHEFPFTNAGRKRLVAGLMARH